MTATTTEAAGRADFSQIRYAQVWEDADILLEALDVQPTDTVVSISSAGDNALALLGAGAARVVALDLNPAQLACLELRVSAYRTLSHTELLVLMGSRPGSGSDRAQLYQRCRAGLSSAVQAFWDGRADAIASGIGNAGKFENYFRLFRTRMLPLVHGRATIDALLRGGSREAREQFYEKHWNTWRWRLLFTVFFSRFMMGRLGRDPAFFKYVEGSVAERILARTRHALTALDPAVNPYLHWILKGTHGTALPWALRAENFDKIRTRLDRLEWHELTIEAFLERERARGRQAPIDKVNLSDIFEYMSEENTAALLARLADASRPAGRLAYWNMLAPRRRPESLAGRLRPRDDLAGPLFAQDKAFFCSAFIVEEVI
jgi:S-adenosylmethionine-diacylglycerol 3-amino-3-carboxypropyl transferase